MSILSLILGAALCLLAVLSRRRQRPSPYRIHDSEAYLREIRARKSGIAPSQSEPPGDFIPAKDTLLGPGSGFLGGSTGGKLSGIAYFGTTRTMEHQAHHD